jgi:predicted aspartyl protease
MKRSTYWVVIIGSVIASVVANQPSTAPLVACVVWIGSSVALTTAIFERARATGRNPWKWFALSFIPLAPLRLGSFPDAANPPPPKLVKTASWSFAAAVAFLVACWVAYGVVYIWAPTKDMVHDRLVGVVNNANASMPKQINEVTTLTAERVEGLKLVYVYELKNDGMVPAQANVAIGVCKSSDMRNAMTQGVSYGYEYRRGGKFLTVFDVTSCPEPALATTTASVTHHSSVDIVLDGSRALAPLSVGSQSIYATVDSGCTDMTVNETIANKLVALGEATDLGMGDVSLADGSVKSMRHIRISTVTIGGHSVYGVTAMVVPDGTMMLLGYNVLRQVSGKFAINTAKSTLDFD